MSAPRVRCKQDCVPMSIVLVLSDCKHEKERKIEKERIEKRYWDRKRLIGTE